MWGHARRQVKHRRVTYLLAMFSVRPARGFAGDLFVRRVGDASDPSFSLSFWMEISIDHSSTYFLAPSGAHPKANSSAIFHPTFGDFGSCLGGEVAGLAHGRPAVRRGVRSDCCPETGPQDSAFDENRPIGFYSARQRTEHRWAGWDKTGMGSASPRRIFCAGSRRSSFWSFPLTHPEYERRWLAS